MVKINGNIPKLIKINGNIPDIVNINGSKVWQNEFTIDCLIKAYLGSTTSSSGCWNFQETDTRITGYKITANHFFPNLYLEEAVIDCYSYKPSSPILIESGKTYNLNYDLEQGDEYWCGIGEFTSPVTLYFSADSPFYKISIAIPSGSVNDSNKTGPEVLYTGKISDIVEKENEIAETK